MRRGLIPLVFLLFFALAGLPAVAFPEVFLHDGIAVPGEQIRLRAETKGRYFAKGGKMVEFVVDGKPYGKSLSGGDGIAYKMFRSFRAGVYSITARSGKDTDNATVMVLRRGKQVVCIDVEGSLLASTFSKKQIEESREAIQAISKRYPVVYLHSGAIGIKPVREWLRKNRFPESIILPWDMGEVFREIKDKGLNVGAVIGGQAVVESAAEFEPKAFTFDEVEGAEKVSGWKEIGKALR